MTENPVLRLGIIADPQYADLAPNLTLDRHFRQSLGKLEEAIDVFNGRDLDAVVTLGDLIDRDWESFDPALAAYRRLRHKALFLPGNHDFAVAPEYLGDVHRRLGMPAQYHDLLVAGHRLVILDGSEVSLFAVPKGHPRREQAKARLQALTAAGAINAQRWNGGLSEAQFTWLAEVLDQARDDGEPVVILCHYPVAPENAHDLWDAQRLLDMLKTYPNVRAWLCGHNHAGNTVTRDGTHYITFRGMVDTPDQNAFAIVSLYEDRLEIEGFGREESRVLRTGK
ncbi:calcineurin-like phosphoesterase family protein [Rhizobium sp. PP-F2F-G38]|nr:calcineurin-like phosphoesterase family protein [Rhizobium sp. PP-WC-1G-195]PYE99538.1 calcineurin-like phosphoesterase family protein [Rhizobium sp. PP-F2F-G38]